MSATLQQSISRRGFLCALGGLACATAGGCTREEPKPRTFSLGLAAGFPEGWTILTLERVALWREGDRFLALSLVCPHQACIVMREAGGFLCPCHGARFGPRGELLQGPAERPMVELATKVDEQGRLMVTVMG